MKSDRQWCHSTDRFAVQNWTRVPHAAQVLLLSVFVVLLAACEARSQAKPPAATSRRAAIAQPTEPKPNIIFVMIDTLRADRIGAYGHPGHLTPTIDALAAEGVLFENCASAAPWTLPSVSSMFCSFYPSVHKATTYHADASKDSRLSRSVAMFDKDDVFLTIPKLLKQQGYATAGFSANPFIRAEHGFGSGFDFWADCMSSDGGDAISAAALDWLDRRGESKAPFFLYLHYMDVHGPYDAQPEFLDPLVEQVEQDPGRKLWPREFNRLSRSLRKPPLNDSTPGRFEELKWYENYWIARYEAGVAEMDDVLSHLVDYLKAHHLWDSAYVILVSDHGQGLCEHGAWDHGSSQFQTALHVPMVLRWPGVLPSGRRVSERVRMIDLLPTLVDQLGGSLPSELQGETLMPLILNQKGSADRIAFAESRKGSLESGHEQKAIFSGSWKLIRQTKRRGEPKVGDTTYRLYNVSHDPSESNDLAPTRPEKVAELRKLLEQQIQRNSVLGRGIIAHEHILSDDAAQRLKSLGYVGDDDDDLE